MAQSLGMVPSPEGNPKAARSAPLRRMDENASPSVDEVEFSELYDLEEIPVDTEDRRRPPPCRGCPSRLQETRVQETGRLSPRLAGANSILALH